MPEHPDPIRSAFAEIDAPAAPPAADVRRRGDRLRRRRQSWTALAVAGLVAAIAIGTAALPSGDEPGFVERPDTGLPTPAPDPPAPQPTAIPDLDLAEGYPAPSADAMLDGPGELPDVLSAIELCTALWRPTDAAATVAVSYRGVEDFRARRVLAYADTASAAAALSTLREAIRACPRQVGEDDSGRVHTLLEVDPQAPWAGDEALLLLQTYEFDGLPSIGQEQVVAVRAGNAVLLASEYSEGPGATAPVRARRLALRTAQKQAGLVEQLCRAFGC